MILVQQGVKATTVKTDIEFGYNKPFRERVAMDFLSLARSIFFSTLEQAAVRRGSTHSLYGHSASWLLVSFPRGDGVSLRHYWTCSFHIRFVVFLLLRAGLAVFTYTAWFPQDESGESAKIKEAFWETYIHIKK